MRTARKLTPKGVATRERIVQGAAELLRERGIEGTTLDDVGRVTRTSRSQLFHYFPDGRNALLLAVAEHEADRVIEDQQPYLGQLSTFRSWLDWRDVVVERYRALGDTCPLGALLQQLGRDDPASRPMVRTMMANWAAALADGIRRTQALGEAPADLDADQAATALLAGLQGGVVLMLSTGETKHLEAALDLGLRQLRPPD
ncbi:TetR/AcrR family transcriptional regulator [Kribbella amoyensis]|uniref:TetR/AcrR family transcriptional regulator n=1 Tax=Kribbella amoyensis TaxID=996641 RepID=UPI0011A64182|nr:TetR/AcrR family transcriptional regulator [Kribbella amoyensis]